MNSLPFIARNALAEPLAQNVTTMHQKMQVLQAASQGRGWIIEPSIWLSLLVLAETNGVCLCRDIGRGVSHLYLSLCYGSRGPLSKHRNVTWKEDTQTHRPSAELFRRFGSSNVARMSKALKRGKIS